MKVLSTRLYDLLSLALVAVPGFRKFFASDHIRLDRRRGKRGKMNLRPDIENWWAVEAMIASYNHVYQVIYNTTYEERGPIGISTYDGKPIASFQYEFLALSADTHAVMEAVRAYPIPPEKEYVLDVFHPIPTDSVLKARYADYGYEFVRTGAILGLDLSTVKHYPLPPHIRKAKTLKQTEVANNSLTSEGERIHIQTLRDKHIHNFFAEADGQAVGWIQLVNVYPNVGYINQLYVMKKYRRQKIGTALVRRVHAEATTLNLGHIVLISSDKALPLYRRLGYKPLLYFSAFRPG